MSKRKKKGRKRKGKLSEAAAKKARQRHWDHGQPSIPVHPDDLDAVPASFSHSLRGSVGWRCLQCKHGFRGEWRARPNSQKRCPRCRSSHIHQQDALYRCLNCEQEYWEFPGGPLRLEYSDPSCPNPDCKLVTGVKHPGSPEERGIYVEWLNYDEWRWEHPVRPWPA